MPGGGAADPRLARTGVRAVLHAAKLSGFAKLVLGAWGCGAFGNSPDLIATHFREQLTCPEFRGAFSDIVFAIIGNDRKSILAYLAKVVKAAQIERSGYHGYQVV